jgi:hypothetical protein
VDADSAKAWFSIHASEGWEPPELQWSVRERMRKFLAEKEAENRCTTSHAQPANDTIHHKILDMNTVELVPAQTTPITEVPSPR